MKIELTVEVEVEHVEGKFIAKDELADELRVMIEGSIDGDEIYVDESTYSIASVTA